MPPVISPTATTATKADSDFVAAGGTITLSHNAGSTANSVLVVDVAWRAGSVPEYSVTGVTYNTVAMAACGVAQPAKSSAISMYVQRWTLALGTPDGAAHNVVVTYGTGNASKSALIIANTYSGVDQTTPYVNYTAGSEGTGTGSSVTVTSATGQLVVATHANAVSGGSFTPVDTETEVGDINRNVNGNTAMCAQYDAGAASVAMGATCSGSSNWRAIGFSLQAAATNAAVPVYLNIQRQMRA